jgi:hypothetical protein
VTFTRHGGFFRALAAGLLLARHSALAAQAPPIYRGFDGKPVQHECHAEVGNLEGLKAALVAHAHALIGFKAKARSGAYYVPKTARTNLSAKAPTEVVKTISQKLAYIDFSKTQLTKSAVLVYDTGVAGGHYSACVWLLSAEGLEAAATVPLPPLSLAELVRANLDVTRRAAARAPARTTINIRWW